jgi:hypothetical protein
LRVAENEMVRRIEGLRKGSKSGTKKIAKRRTLYFMSFTCVVRMTKAIRMTWNGEIKNAYQILIIKAQN